MGDERKTLTTWPTDPLLDAVGREYQRRDPVALGEHYARHVRAMTEEGLHSKSAIAAELAWRDAEIERLRAQLAAREPNHVGDDNEGQPCRVGEKS